MQLSAMPICADPPCQTMRYNTQLVTTISASSLGSRARTQKDASKKDGDREIRVTCFSAAWRLVRKALQAAECARSWWWAARYDPLPSVSCFPGANTPLPYP